MDPILFHSQYIIIQSLWLFISLAFIISSIFFIKIAKASSLRLNFILDHGFKFIISGLVFSRILYIIQNWEIFFYDFSFWNIKYVFYFWDKGLSFWGAILGVFIAFKYLCKKYEEDTNKWLDVAIIAFFLALFIGCIGLFLDGSSYGHETNLPWGINFESITIRYSVPIHPTQLYAAFYNLILLIVFLRLHTKHIFKHHGDVFLAGISTFCFFKFLEEFFRGDEVFEFFGIRETFFYTLIIGLISLFLLLERYNKVDLSPVRKLLRFNKKTQHGNS